MVMKKYIHTVFNPFFYFILKHFRILNFCFKNTVSFRILLGGGEGGNLCLKNYNSQATVLDTKEKQKNFHNTKYARRT